MQSSSHLMSSHLMSSHLISSHLMSGLASRQFQDSYKVEGMRVIILFFLSSGGFLSGSYTRKHRQSYQKYNVLF